MSDIQLYAMLSVGWTPRVQGYRSYIIILIRSALISWAGRVFAVLSTSDDRAPASVPSAQPAFPKPVQHFRDKHSLGNVSYKIQPPPRARRLKPCSTCSSQAYRDRSHVDGCDVTKPGVMDGYMGAWRINSGRAF